MGFSARRGGGLDAGRTWFFVWAHHGIRFTRASLAVRKNTRIVTVEGIIEQSNANRLITE